MTCVTPSNPDPLPAGESLDISGSLAATGQGSLFRDGRSMRSEGNLELLSAPAAGVYPDPLATVQQPRMETSPFLVAQTETSPAKIRKLWLSSKEGTSLPARPSLYSTRSARTTSDSGPLRRSEVTATDVSRLRVAPQRVRAWRSPVSPQRPAARKPWTRSGTAGGARLQEDGSLPSVSKRQIGGTGSADDSDDVDAVPGELVSEHYTSLKTPGRPPV